MSPSGIPAVHIELPELLAESAPLPWALTRLRDELARRGVALVRAGQPGADAGAGQVGVGVGANRAGTGVTATVMFELAPELAAESFAISSTMDTLVVRGADPRGLAYGLTELADRARYADDPLAAIRRTRVPAVTPAARVRGVLRAFSSDVLDLPWFRDCQFWTGYLDELAEQRINRVQLALGMQYNYSHDPDVRDNYLCFAYPFLIEVPGWEQVRVAGVDATERALNLGALVCASDEAAQRGIHFQLGLWNHAVQPEPEGSPRLRYRISGLPDEQIAEYSAHALRILLAACPGIAGVTFRVHYEGGVPERGHGAFWRTVMSGLAGAGRPLDVDLHAKGVDAELLDAARASGARVIVSGKYWAEHQGLPYHQASVRPLEKARPAGGDRLRGVTQNARRFTRYGYGDFLGEDRGHDVLFRVWPGTQRFLIWADPELFAGYGRLSTIGGALGVELCEPLTFRGRKDTGRDGLPRDLYVDGSLREGRDDWRKYRYEYRLWGRLLYDPDSDPESWQRMLRADFGSGAEYVAAALAAGGKILPLVTVTQSLSASNNFFWPEVFTDMPIARRARSQTYGFDLAEPGTWGSVSPFDPVLFDTADAYTRALLDAAPSGRITPDDVASLLDGFATAARRALDAAHVAVPDPAAPVFRRIAVDVVVEVLLARFFAGKIRAGVGYSLFRATDDPEQLRAGIDAYRAGRDALAEVVSVTEGVYGGNLAFGDRPSEQGHWRDRLAQVDADLAELSKELDEARIRGAHGDGRAAAARRAVRTRRDGLDHVPPRDFVHGETLPIEATTRQDGLAVDLHVRHLNQGEEYLVLAMTGDGPQRVAIVPAAYTADRFPLEYFFVVRAGAGREAWTVPGLDPNLSNQPYHVVSGRAA